MPKPVPLHPSIPRRAPCVDARSSLRSRSDARQANRVRRHGAYLASVLPQRDDPRPPLDMVWFAGGGGSSCGARQALGKDPDYALNHDAVALRMHEVNHLDTVHLCADAFAASPTELEPGRPIRSMWFSPDCTDFSKAKGAAPRSPRIRGLAWCAIPWAKLRRPDVIFLENVEEFEFWGPVYHAEHPLVQMGLERAGEPIKSRRGETFARFVRRLRQGGYVVEYRCLVAADYGAATTRKRFFLIARSDGKPIVWPARTHAPRHLAEALGLKAWVGASEIIDWSIAGHSIFLTQAEAKDQGLKIKRPLVDATMRRIARGIERYVIGAPEPFIVPITNRSWGGDRVRTSGAPLRTLTTSKGGEFAVAAPVLIGTAYGDNRPGAGLRAWPMRGPLRTLTGSKNEGVCEVQLGHITPLTHHGPARIYPPGESLRTVTGAHRGEFALVTTTLTCGFNIRTDFTGARFSGVYDALTPARTMTGAGGLATVSVLTTPWIGPPEPLVFTAGPVDFAGPVAAAFLFGCGGRRGQSPEIAVSRPCPTGTGKADTWLAVPYLVPAYSERAGQAPRVSDVAGPYATAVPNGSGGRLVTAWLGRQFGSTVSGRPIGDPHPTIMTEGGGGKSQVITAVLDRSYGKSAPADAADPLKAASGHPHDGVIAANLISYYRTGAGSDMANPVRTATGEDRHGVVASFLEQANTGMTGRAASDPVSTLMGAGTQQRVIEARLQAMGAAPGSRRRQVLDFLWAHFGAPDAADWNNPTGTEQARLRWGLVLLTGADGQVSVWEIADIAMRMLTPRELFNAQGFPRDYIIDRDVRGRKITGTAATLMCGNSVSPEGHAGPLYAANFPQTEPGGAAAEPERVVA